MASFKDDANALRRIVDRWWSHRWLHESIDGVKVDAVFDRLADDLRDVKSVWQCAISLRDNLWHLMDGHLRLGPTHWRGETLYLSGLRCMPVAEGIAIVDVEPRLRPTMGSHRGDLIVEADGQRIEDYLASVRLRSGSTPQHRRWNAVQSLVWQERFPEETPSPQALTLENEHHIRRTIAIAWETAVMSRPTPFCVTARTIHEDIGLLDVRSFVCRDELGQVSDAEMLRQVSAARDRLNGMRHVVVDLRGNGGGRDEQAQFLARMLTASPVEWMRVSRRNPVTGEMDPPAAIPLGASPPLLESSLSGSELWFLLGPGCASTSEILAAAFQAQQTVRTVGATTAGSAGDPVDFRLPDSLLAITVPVASYYLPRTNVPVETHGVFPDTTVMQTAEDLRRGVDTTVASVVAAITQAR